MMYLHLHGFRDVEFKEQEHPRDQGGKFTAGSGFRGGGDKPVRFQGWTKWGASHSNSHQITGSSAKLMGISGYRPPNDEKLASNYAHRFLTAIKQSTGSDETLYHGFQNMAGTEYKIGKRIKLPLTATSGDIEDSAGYGIRLDPKDQEAEPTVYEFPTGTKFIGYSKWSKQDQEDFGHKWAEAIVAGEFEVSDIREGQESAWRKRPYKIVTLKPVSVFNPDSHSWDKVT
jgi:hypothetical protein